MNTKKLLVTILLALLAASVFGQKIGKKDHVFVYRIGEIGAADSSLTEVRIEGSIAYIVPQQAEARYVPGYAVAQTSVDYAADSICVRVEYTDSAYYYRTPLSRNDIEWKVEGPAHSRLYTCSINSNTLVFEMDESVAQNATPLPYYGLRRGVLRSFTRNGQRLVQLVQSSRHQGAVLHKEAKGNQQPPTRCVTPHELNRIMTDRLVVTTHIFDNVQLHWGEQDAHVAGAIPYDTVLHYAGGTLALKRLRLPKLPPQYQYFLELHQRSNGDAYDRTGSVFIIPGFNQPETPTFFDGINHHPDSLPVVVGRDAERYQGIRSDRSPMWKYRNSASDYQPPVELMRFFTPFGVGHFNERMADYNTHWADEAYYKQEVTDLAPLLQDEVLIGIWIGNYDGGGHIVSLDLKAYPTSATVADSIVPLPHVYSLFNTCNVLEMAGQNYGKVFGTDTLTTPMGVRLSGNAKHVRLRLIATGHGGWDAGDEFTPKTVTVLIDGQPAFTYTPWREDCGSHRHLNPVSGNFWNGLSSSDYSRSGWCPGTATQPTYFDLDQWADGEAHHISIAIEQGQPVSGMFSHWAVSAAVLEEYE